MALTDQKILDHLKNHPYYINTLDARWESTQQGIAECVGRERSAITKFLIRLEKDGTIFSELRHVKGRERRVKVYYLTERGMTSIETINKKEPKSSMPFVSDEKPSLAYLVGREEEQRIIHHLITSNEPKVLVVKGMAGVGKTTLVSTTIDQYRGDKNILWLELGPWSSPNSILIRLSKYLSAIGRTGLKELVTKKKFETGELSLVLENDLNGLDIIFVFDNYSINYNNNVQDRIAELLNIINKTPCTDAIIVGREIPPFLEGAHSLNVEFIWVNCLNEEDSSKLLEHENVDEKLHSRLFSITNGHPLALQLFAKFDERGKEMTSSYLEEAIFSSISSDEQHMLEFTSFLRHSTDPETLLEIAHSLGLSDISHETLDAMIEKSLFYTAGEKIVVHDLIRSLFVVRISPPKIREYQVAIAKYYINEPGVELEGILEALYHFVNANEYDRVHGLLQEYGKALINKGFWNEVLESIEKAYSYLQDLEQADLLLQKGFIFCRILGEVDSAIGIYEEARRVYSQNNDDAREAKAFYGLGLCYSTKSMYEEAIIYLDKGLEKMNSTPEEDILSDIYMRRGYALGMTGRGDEGIKELEKSLETYKRTGSGDMDQICHNIAATYIYGMGDVEKGLEILETYLNLADIEKHNLLNTYQILGTLYGINGDFEKAIEWLEQAIELAEDMGSVRILSSSLGNMSEAYLNAGHLDQAEEYVKRSIALSKRAADLGMGKSPYENSMMNYAAILLEKGELEESKKIYEEILEEKEEEKYIRGQTMHNYGKLLFKMGDKKGSKKVLMQCKKKFVEIGNKHFENQVSDTLKELGL